MKQVDNVLADALGGLTSEDLSDAGHMDAFEDGLSPDDWADELLADAGMLGCDN